MNEEMNNNQDTKNEISTETSKTTEEVATPQSEPVVEQVQVQPSEEPIPTTNVEQQKKKKFLLPIIIILILLLGLGVFLYFGTDIFKSKNKDNSNQEQQPDTPPVTTEIDKYEGIYAAQNDKLYIYKTSDTEFHYVIGGNFIGFAKLNGDVAKQKDAFKDDGYFEFKLVDDGIEVSYIADENVSVVVDTGKYTKVADYTKENVYKEAVGDPSYLDLDKSGLFKNEDIELYVFQISENEIMVKSSDNSTDVFFDEKFEKEINEINGEISFVSKSFFDEDKNAFLMNFYDNSIEIIVYDDVFGFDEDDKKLENNYKFERKITEEEIIKEFYSNY